LEETGVKATSRFLGLIFIMGLLVSLELIFHRRISDFTIYTIAGIIGYMMAMRIVLELSLRQAYFIRAERIFLDPLIENTNVRTKLVVRNDGPIPIFYVTVNDLYPELFRKVSGHSRTTCMLIPKSSVELNYTVKPVLGKHRYGGVELVIRDPAGLFNYKLVLKTKQDIVRVKPKPLPIPKGIAYPIASRSLGLGRSRIRGIGQEFMTLREYVPGDDYRFIDWKSYARLRKLYVKEFEKEASLSLVVIIDASREMMKGIMGTTAIEHVARATAGIAKNVLHRGDWISVAIRSGEYLSSGYGRGRYHLYRILSVISSIEWRDNRPRISLGDVVFNEIKKIPRRTKTIFILFTILENQKQAEEIISIANTLRQQRHIFMVIQPVPELFEIKKFKGAEAGLYLALMRERIMRSKKLSEHLVRNGIRTVNVGPDDLLPMTLKLIDSLRTGVV
ncbi:MAG: DUF58 domain-containing protein, partial [Crenarchaeota archaeon]|nr:DUF58 domain-containing protein [Thermoproteota archaeon]